MSSKELPLPPDSFRNDLPWWLNCLRMRRCRQESWSSGRLEDNRQRVLSTCSRSRPNTVRARSHKKPDRRRVESDNKGRVRSVCLRTDLQTPGRARRRLLLLNFVRSLICLDCASTTRVPPSHQRFVTSNTKVLDHCKSGCVLIPAKNDSYQIAGHPPHHPRCFSLRNYLPLRNILARVHQNEIATYAKRPTTARE